MSLSFELRDLVDYTSWQRGLWQSWFAQKGSMPLAVTTGPHGDGRFSTVGGLIRHIFSAEFRFSERIAGLPLTDTTAVPFDDAAALFRFGAESREGFLLLLHRLPAERWSEPFEFPLLDYTVQATPRKVALHVLTHEIRHWAQVATLLRVQGWIGDRQDLLFSPVLGGSIRSGTAATAA